MNYMLRTDLLATFRCAEAALRPMNFVFDLASMRYKIWETMFRKTTAM